MAAADQGEGVLAQAVAAYQDALGPRLLAGYALGSLAHGGFSPLVSDVDLGLVLRDPLKASDRAAVEAVAGAVRAAGTVLHERLSVFWGTPSTLAGRAAGGRFPAFDRLDLLEHGRLLTGTDARPAVARPDQAELLVAGAQFALGYLAGPEDLASTPPGQGPGSGPGRGPGPGSGPGSGPAPPAGDAVQDEIAAPARLVSRGPRRLTKVVLFPVRFLFTAATGRVATNSAAADFYLARGPAPAAELVTAALAWREQPPADPAAAAALVRRELIPLYLQYIEDHAARLAAAGHDGLADRFSRWRIRLER